MNPFRDHGDRNDRNLECDQETVDRVSKTKYEKLEESYHSYLIVLMYKSKIKYSTPPYDKFTKEAVVKLVEADLVNRINDLNKQMVLSWKPPKD